LEGIRIAKSMGIQKLTILGDSMLVIRVIIKRSITGSNVFTGVMYRSLTLLKEFEEFFYSTLRESSILTLIGGLRSVQG
jgi:hypothetical protein